jgi:hypothetical protein
MFLSGAEYYVLAALMFDLSQQICFHIIRSVLEDDDICVVAKLLGDIMAYRASGTGHLELIAGWFSIHLVIQITVLFDLGDLCVYLWLKLWFRYTFLVLVSTTQMIFGRVFIVAEVQAVNCYFKRASRGSS